MASTEEHHDSGRRRTSLVIGLIILCVVLVIPLWATWWFQQRAELLNLASDVGYATSDSANTAELRVFQNPTSLAFPDDVRLSASQIRTIAEFHDLRHLSVAGLRDDDVCRLRDLRALHTLILRDVELSDRGLSAIAEMSELRHLILTSTDDVSGQDPADVTNWDCLAGLPKLEILTLAHDSLADESLQSLSQCGQLISLSVRSERIRGTGLSHFGSLGALFDLRLDGCRLESLSSLQAGAALRVLWLRETQNTDAALKDLSVPPGLVEIHLENSQASEEGVKQLQQAHPQLKVFDSDGKVWPAPASSTK